MPESVIVSHTLELDFPDDLMENARNIGEDSDRVCELMQQFKDLIFEKGDCNPHRMDDEFLIRFLRARFWKVENAYKLLSRYTHFRGSNMHWIDKVHPLSLTVLGEEDIMTITPYLDQTKKRMMIFRFGNWKPSKIPVDELFKATLICLEVGIMEPRAQVNGGVGIFDMEGFGLNHTLHMSPTIAQKMIAMMVTSFPYRTTAIHIVNQGWFFDVAFAFFKPFLNDAMRSKLYLHGTNYKSLHKHIDPSNLPKRYGGVMEDYSYKPWIDHAKANKRVIKELELHGYCTDEFYNTAE
ncbi:alpha-tocopherol transfer protein-like [Chironomus tepperi]|uniref:alpha-tocopherol transfer protein-like n=1 Tax=Chironomus tepperi TaxID=113505 RepID=UPI00391EF4BC